VRRRAATLGVGSALSIALVAAGAFLPVPYVALVPGPVYDTIGTDPKNGHELICIAGREHEELPGDLGLTTVQVREPLNLATALQLWLDPDAAVLPREAVYGRNRSAREVEQENTRTMIESQDNAVVAALHYLGYRESRTAALIEGISSDAKPRDQLQERDEVTSVDGVKVQNVAGIRRLVAKHKVGEEVRVGVLRGCVSMPPVAMTVIADPDDAKTPRIGIDIRDVPRFPISIDISLEEVGGPSAGLMFAVGIVDKLTKGSLTKGNVIAGTGEIDPNGNVSRIGGVHEKMVAARRDAHAAYFLAPVKDVEAAKGGVPKGLTVIPVNNLREAIDAIRKLPPASGFVESS
jgi:PDZ domain-containing protein